MPLSGWRDKARALRMDTYALYLACRDPRSPWYAKALAVVVVGYAFSPIDLIPDMIPVLGYLDDLVLVPLGVALVLRLLPAEVLADCRAKARARLEKSHPQNWLAATVIVLVWAAVLGWGGYRLARRF